jgi:hypothetical protein
VYGVCARGFRWQRRGNRQTFANAYAVLEGIVSVACRVFVAARRWELE